MGEEKKKQKRKYPYLSFRLREKTAKTLRALKRQEGVSFAEVIRAGVELYAARVLGGDDAEK